MNGRRARQRRREQVDPVCDVVVVRGLRAMLDGAPWKPPSAAGIEIGRRRTDTGLAIICDHQLMTDTIDRQVEAVAAWQRIHPECPVKWCRYYFEPPSAMIDTFSLSAKPDAPAHVLDAVGSVNLIAASARAYIEDNPPEACGCDPGLELVFRIGSHEPSVLRMCHEKWCAHVGRPPARQRLTMLTQLGGLQ